MAFRRYQAGDRIHVQAQQVWGLLTAYATFGGRQPISYGDLAEWMGKDRRAGITLGRQLGIVGRYCLANDCPPLNVIVVGRDGRPGEGVVTRVGKTIKQDQKAVFKYEWLKVRPPLLRDLQAIWEGREE